MVGHCWTDHHAGQVIGEAGFIAAQSNAQATVGMHIRQSDAKDTCRLYCAQPVIIQLISRPLITNMCAR